VKKGRKLFKRALKHLPDSIVYKLMTQIFLHMKTFYKFNEIESFDWREFSLTDFFDETESFSIFIEFSHYLHSWSHNLIALCFYTLLQLKFVNSVLCFCSSKSGCFIIASLFESIPPKNDFSCWGQLFDSFFDLLKYNLSFIFSILQKKNLTEYSFHFFSSLLVHCDHFKKEFLKLSFLEHFQSLSETFPDSENLKKILASLRN
jgi:hypothetical protein